MFPESVIIVRTAVIAPPPAPPPNPACG